MHSSVYGDAHISGRDSKSPERSDVGNGSGRAGRERPSPRINGFFVKNLSVFPRACGILFKWEEV